MEKTRYLSKERLFISDDPYSYITLYANADRCYTDMVHATIICLEYGTPVKYWKIDERMGAFESLPYVYKDSNGFLKIDKIKLEDQKRCVERYLFERLKRLKA